jgi:hypothetical protein
MISSLLTVKEKIEICQKIKDDWSATSSNTYVGIGRVRTWSDGDVTIPVVDNSIDTLNGVFDNLFAIKKITDNDMALVAPRIDWQTSGHYYAYDNTIDVYSKYNSIAIANGSVSVFTANANVVGSIASTFTYDYVVGDMIEVYDSSINTKYKREIVSITNNQFMVVNTSFNLNLTTAYYYNTFDSSPGYSYPFYVRNSYDQVFKCLANNNGALSTTMPEINIGGQLPQNPYILTGDGYKWKYLYTIPSGLKKKFFTADWMPAVSDAVVTAYAVDGSIDVVKLIDGGSGYNGGVSSIGAQIITVNGNGADANITAVVSETGEITDWNIINGGSGYTYATITVDPGISFGSGANLIPVISPHGGNGGDPAYELGATTFMLCLELNGDEDGAIPVISSGGTGIFDYHQISVIRNPKTAANIFVTASNTVYDCSTVVTMNPFPSGVYQTDDTAYQGTSLETATFTASIVNSDATARKLYLNNIRGTLNLTDLNNPIKAVLTGATYSPTGIILSDLSPYTGDVLYVENRPGVSRAVDQTEQIKLIIQV